MFLPTTQKEMQQLGWRQADVVLVTGDSYIDSPYVGVSVIGKLLMHAGYRVGIIAQPDINSDQDIKRLGEPLLFWGVTGGCIDSMVANYTPTGKKRKKDDYTPGRVNNRRPDRAVIAYTNLIRRYYKATVPIVLGGIEASLRRIAHYDYWSDQIRRSILFDAKADLLLYGMADHTILRLAETLKQGKDHRQLPGLCFISHERPDGYLELPDFQRVAIDKIAFIDMFTSFYQNNDPISAIGLTQRQDTRFLVQNPPAPHLTEKELDAIYEMDFEHDHHPYYQLFGAVAALDTIKFSITTHRGCYGECNFCAIGVHQGRTVISRSRASILAEAQRMVQHADFKGYIQDVGGPTANMYGYECKKKLRHGACTDKRCLFPTRCDQLLINHRPQMALLEDIRRIKGIKRAFVRSGIRYDLLLTDSSDGLDYLRQIIHHHTSGQLKVAPEHCVAHILNYMGKCDISKLISFKQLFDQLSGEMGKRQFLTYYLMAAHPGCTIGNMQRLNEFARHQLHITPEQIQIFTPTPSTYSSLMYWTEMNPFDREPVFVEKDKRKKEIQKKTVLAKRNTPHHVRKTKTSG
ncbi:MAG: YgiQ family radical SAM protein [Desulfobacterales bacterium]|nr:YgiQ family radical SAM protein [Desulfobacterales bacterium]